MAATQTNLLVKYQDVVARMQINSELAGAAEVVQSAIQGAQLHLESVLTSVFNRNVVSAVFFADSEAFSGMQPDGYYRLELPTAFVRSDVPPIVSVGTSFDLSDQVPLPTNSYRFDKIRGYLLLQAKIQRPTSAVGQNNAAGQTSFVDDMYVQVQYESGFTGIVQNNAVSPPTQTTAAEDIPSWLYEAIMSYVPVIFDSSQVTNRNQEAQAQYKKAGDHAVALLSPYMRNLGFSFRTKDYTVTPVVVPIP